MKCDWQNIIMIEECTSFVNELNIRSKQGLMCVESYLLHSNIKLYNCEIYEE